jgi:Fe-S cluster assembly ATPase SufC
MQYTFTKDYSFFKAGDILTWDKDINAFTMDEENENGFRVAMLDERTVEDIYEQGFLSTDKDQHNKADETIDKTVELIDTLINKYESDYKEVIDKYSEGEIQPCVKVEAETVYYNLNKVLTKIKNTLKNE